jgi:MFS family permease
MKNVEKSIFIINLITFLTAVSYETVFTVLPFYLSTVIGVSMFVIGLVEGGYDLISNFVKIFSGYWADFLRKRNILITGLLFSLFSKLYFIFGKKWIDVVIATSLEAISEGIQTPVNDTYLSSGKKNKLGRIFGINRAFENIGAVIGIFIALLYTWLFIEGFSYQEYFAISTMPVFMAILLVFFLPKEKKPVKKYPIPVVSWEAFFPKYIVLFFLLALIDFGYSFYVLKAYEQTSSEAFTVFIYLIFTITIGFASLTAGKFFDRLGEKRYLSLVSVFFFVSHLLMIFFPVAGFLLFAFADAFLDIGIWATVGKKIRFRKGFVFGTYHFTVGFASLISGMVAGYLWDTVNPDFPFFVGSFISLIIYFIIRKHF